MPKCNKPTGYLPAHAGEGEEDPEERLLCRVGGSLQNHKSGGRYKSWQNTFFKRYFAR